MWDTPPPVSGAVPASVPHMPCIYAFAPMRLRALRTLPGPATPHGARSPTQAVPSSGAPCCLVLYATKDPIPSVPILTARRRSSGVALGLCSTEQYRGVARVAARAAGRSPSSRVSLPREHTTGTSPSNSSPSRIHRARRSSGAGTDAAPSHETSRRGGSEPASNPATNAQSRGDQNLVSGSSDASYPAENRDNHETATVSGSSYSQTAPRPPPWVTAKGQGPLPRAPLLGWRGRRSPATPERLALADGARTRRRDDCGMRVMDGGDGGAGDRGDSGGGSGGRPAATSKSPVAAVSGGIRGGGAATSNGPSTCTREVSDVARVGTVVNRGKRPRARPTAAARVDGVDGGGVVGVGGDGEQPRRITWRTKYVPEDLAPDLPTFAASVRREGANWHPLRISAALNHAVKLKDAALVRDKASRVNGGGGGGNRASGGDGLGGPAETAATTVVRQVLNDLYDALMPHISSIGYPRYAVNPLWVCAKTGCWGAPGNSSSSNGNSSSGFVAALLTRLRQDNYALLQEPNGQTHGVLWWALSEYDRQQRQQQQQQRSAAAAARQQASVDAVADASPRRDGDIGARDMMGHAAAATEGEGNEEGGAGPQTAPEDIDLLRVSASVLKRHKMLDAESFKPQSFCNMFLAAARLNYSDDPEFIECLLENMIRHPGPFQPQDISNAVYALGELYGTEDDDVDGGRRNTASSAGTDRDDEARRKTGSGAEEAAVRGGRRRYSDGAGVDGADVIPNGAAAAQGSWGRLSPALAAHMRALADLAIRIGLDRFNPQALSNTLYGLARLKLRLEDGSPGDDNPVGQPGPAAAAGGAAGSRLRAPRQTPSFAEAPEGQPSGSASRSLCRLLADPDAGARVLVIRLAEHIHERLQRDPRAFNPQDLGNATWALAALGYTDQSYYTVAVQAALKGCMDAATPQNWAMFLRALVEVDHKPPQKLVEQLRRSVCGSGGGGGVRGGGSSSSGSGGAGGRGLLPSQSQRSWSSDLHAWSSLPWLLASLGLPDAAVMGWITRAAHATCCRGLKPHWLSRSLWALAVLPEGSLSQHWELAVALVEAVNKVEVQQLHEPELAQLWQAHLELEAAAATTLSPLPRTTGYAASFTSTTATAPTTTTASPPTATATTTATAVAAVATSPSLVPKGAGQLAAEEEVLGSGAILEAPWQRRLRLRPELVVAGRQVMARISSQIALKPATAFQRAVHSYLCSLIADPAATAARWSLALKQQEEQQQQEQQQQQGQQQQGQKQQGQKQKQVEGRRRRAGSSSEELMHDAVGSCSVRRRTVGDSEVDNAEVGVMAATCVAPAHGAASPHSPGTIIVAGTPDGSAAASLLPTGRATDGASGLSVLRVEQEWFVEPLAMCVDVCVWLSDGRQVVVEADGPLHFFSNERHSQRPRSALRDRQLGRVFGGRDNVKCVPHWEWDVLGGAATKTAYLKRLLGL